MAIRRLRRQVGTCFSKDLAKGMDLVLMSSKAICYDDSAMMVPRSSKRMPWLVLELMLLGILSAPLIQLLRQA